MAVDKLVDSSQLDADLTSVANAIRTKGGTSASLAFPADFVSAIGAIPTGGGGSWDMAAGTVTPASDSNTVNVSVAFEPEYAVIYTDPYETAQTNTWKLIAEYFDRAVFGTSTLVRYNNGSYGGTYGGLTQSDVGAYSSGVFTITRVGNYKFLNGVTYKWFCWREKT